MTMSEERILTDHLDHFLKSREPPKTFCPSEVARAITPDQLNALGLAGWRDAMPAVRELAWYRRDQGDLEILQKGTVLPGDTKLEDVVGPIRIRRAVA